VDLTINNLKLRKATAEDREFVFQTKKAAFKHYAEQVWGWDEDEQRRLHTRRFASQDFQVIQVSGMDAGILAVVRQADGVIVKQIYILPEYQSQGIGAACMLQITQDAASASLPVRLQVLKVNLRAIEFYKRLGFSSYGESDTHVLLEKVPS
jgi:ribosomal protein S18 acetylase RimI-like enzyme